VNTLRVVAFTAGRDVPSARFRLRQYIAPLARESIAVREYYPWVGGYPPTAEWLRPAWAALSLAERLPGVIASRRADVTFLQREMLSTFHTLEHLTGTPRVLDVDDSIHLLRGGRAARALGRHVDLVIAGNAFLADVWSKWAPRVALLPTAVDTQVLRPQPPPARPVLGWIGTGANLPFLRSISAALEAALARVPDAMLEVCCNVEPNLPLPAARVRWRPWSLAAESEHFAAISVGLMPLHDTDFARGKCSFKMLQYMACGRPVIVSPVGMNREVLARGECGVGVMADEWTDAIISLLQDPARASRLGAVARTIVEAEFSLARLAPRLTGLLRSVT
jgi:glycosyltransferase involved in cell wall biosynthesis